MKSLLPPNSTALEKRVSDTCKPALELPSINIVKDIDRVPSQFLPFLAYQKSVDFWDENWQESLKREVIKSSRSVHKFKGTVFSIKRALEVFGYELKLIEWFQTTPNLKPGTFNLEVDLIGKSLNKETYNEINRLVSDAKSVSRHLSSLSIISTPLLIVQNTLAHQSALTFLSEPRS